MTDIPDRTHNALLDSLLTRGVFGLILWMSTLLFLAYLYLKRKLVDPLSQAAFFGLISYIISIQFSFSLSTHIIFFLGFLGILLLRTQKIPLTIVVLPRVAKFTVALSIIFLSGFFITQSIRLIETDRYFSKGIGEYIDNSTTALSTFNTALSISPNYSYLYRSLAILYGKTLPVSYVDRFGTVSGNSFQYFLVRAATVRDDDKIASEQFFDEAVKKAPNSAIVWSERGDVAFEDGNCGLAVPSYKKLISLAPSGEDYFKKNQGFFTALANLQSCLARDDIRKLDSTSP